jgi:hypothetical protein
MGRSSGTSHGEHGMAGVDRQRRMLLLGAAAIALPLAAFAAPARTPAVEVWKSPICGCCKDWVAHLQANGFVVRVHDDGNTEARSRLKIPTALGSCHTAQVAGYAIEGHVPAREIHRLLRERPQATGLAVPAMPLGSPGMDSPAYGGRKTQYDVLLVLHDGSHRVFQSYR